MQEIKYIDIDLLTYHPENPRIIKEENFKKLCESIKKNPDYFETRPILCNPQMIIFAGNMRWRAAKEIGLTQVPVAIMDIPLERQREIMIRDNIENGSWDFDILANNFDIPELVDFGFNEKDLDFHFDEPNEKDDQIPEIKGEPISKLGDLYILGRHRVLCGDSTKKEDVEKLMDGKKANMVFTDPPYGVAYADKNKFLNSIDKGNCIQTEIENDHKTIEELEDIIYSAFCHIKENLSEKASYYITAPQGGDLLMMMMMMMKSGLILRHMLIWVKNNQVLGRTDYNYKHEPILYGWVNSHNFYGNGEFQFSTWEISKPLKSDLHPTMKPIALIINALQNSTKIEDICLDLFLGSGSTLIACEKTNRICYGMEIDPHYCDVIIKRYCQYIGNNKVIKNGQEIEWEMT